MMDINKIDTTVLKPYDGGWLVIGSKDETKQFTYFFDTKQMALNWVLKNTTHDVAINIYNK